MADLVARLAASLADLEAAYAVRHEVFVVEQGVPVWIERDAFDGVADHALVEVDGNCVAAGRLIPRREGALAGGLIGRMAVRAAARGGGVGRSLLRRLEQAALDRGLANIELHAQEHAAGFYKKAGYDGVGEPFLEAGIRHVSMRRDLPLIRDAVDADGAALEKIIGGCFAEYEGCVLDVDTEEPWLREPASAYAAKGGHIWAAELAGEVVACGAWRPVGERVVELKSLYVAPAARGHGLGAYFTGRVEAVAHSRGADAVEFWSDTRFEPAHRLYRRLGYEQLPETRGLGDLSNSTEYHFRKRL